MLEGVSGPLKVIGAGDEEVAEIGRIAVEIENAEAAPGKAWWKFGSSSRQAVCSGQSRSLHSRDLVREHQSLHPVRYVSA